MKKITVIIAALAAVSVFAFAGCQKQEAPKPAVQSTMSSTMTSTMTTTAPAAAPERK